MIIKKKRDFTPNIINNSEMKDVKFYPFITKKDGAPNFAMRLFEVGPDGHTTRHKHEWEHEVYIVSGNGYVLEGDKKIRVERDCCIFIKSNELHQFQAGENGLSMICVVPNKGQPK